MDIVVIIFQTALDEYLGIEWDLALHRNSLCKSSDVWG